MLLLAWLIVLLVGIGYILWKSRGTQPILKPAGGDFLYSEPKPDITEMYVQRTQSPAPAYMKSGNYSQTGFNFNTAPEEEYDEKRGVTNRDTVFPSAYQAKPIQYYTNPEKPNPADRSRFSE